MFLLRFKIFVKVMDKIDYCTYKFRSDLKSDKILLVTVIRYTFMILLFTKTPLLACLILVFLTLIIRIFISFISSKWISYLVILLFLGGIIVLFVYICTLISKIKVLIKTSYKKYFYGGFILILFFFLNFFKKSDFVGAFNQLRISFIYQKSRIVLLVFATVYLLVMLIISIKIIQKHKGGLKSKTYA